MNIFDIETGPLPVEEAKVWRPEFKAPANYRDPEKIWEYEMSAELKWQEGLALSPTTGRVLAAGLVVENQFIILDQDDEAELLKQLVSYLKEGEWAGWNIYQFDLPFIVTRCWKLGIRVPWSLAVWDRKELERFIDLRRVWGVTERNPTGTLGQLAQWLGFGKKPEDGKDFAKWWREDRARARQYIMNDLELTHALYRRLLGTETGANNAKS